MPISKTVTAGLALVALAFSLLAGCRSAPDPAAGTPGYYKGPMAPVRRNGFDSGRPARAGGPAAGAPGSGSPGQGRAGGG